MKEITSLNNPLVKTAASLHQKKYRDETRLFLVEGREPCESAIRNGWECVHVFMLAQKAGETFPPLTEDMREEGVIHVTREILEKITRKTNPQDVVGVFRQRVYDTPVTADFTLALEEIRDPGNLGTIMRTAHAVGVTNIILVGPCCDPFNPEVIRASMGSFAVTRLVQMSVDALLQWRAHNHLALLGTDVTNAVDYRQADYSQAILVMGNEQKGLSPQLKKHCTARVHIPMPGGTESLNLSIATALLLYQSQGL